SRTTNDETFDSTAARDCSWLATARRLRGPGQKKVVAVIRGLVIAGLLFTVVTIAPAMAQLRSDVLEKFAGDRWDRIPLSSEDPTIALRLCGQPHEDPCTVVAEIWLTLPQGDRAP